MNRSNGTPGAHATGLASNATDTRILRATEEYAALVHAGETPDRELFLARYADIADELGRCLDSLDFLDAARRSLGGAMNALPDEHDLLASAQPLGDYRLIREVGHGGMGIVYEAEQLSLGRRVALKVLPFAATMDPKQLQRFRNEALAAASLRHDHIVHVYGVGCERGVHFYAMEFIDGQTLADIISAMREELHHGATEDTEKRIKTLSKNSPCSPCLRGKSSSVFRSIASLIADAADALDHAHELGVVHRDIKPGNLMLDENGRIWITDFGLAKQLSPAVHGGADLTLTGDLLGTLRYMAPEQALAKHGLVDHRTDIYSLGATLYELLTLHPAVPGDDKAEILNAIAWDDPTPLRKLDKSIPPELETITLKCLAKEPGERYATAGEMAADLRRWIAHQTIKAKPPSVMGRIDKWARRHKYLTRSAIVVVTLIAVGLGIGAVLLDREKRRAVTAEQTATAVKDFFVYDLLQLAAADRQAEERGTGVQVDPDLKVRDVLLRAAREIEGKFPDQPLVEAEIRNTLGRTLNGIGLPDQAILQLQRAWEIRSAILGPDDPRAVRCMINLSNSYADLGQGDKALKLCQEALSLTKAKFGLGHRQTLLRMNNLASIYNDQFGRHAEAALLFEETLAVQKDKFGPDDPDTLRTINNLAISYTDLGRYADAWKLLEEALPLLKAKLGTDHPETLSGMHNLAVSYADLGRGDDALKLSQEVLALRKAKLGPGHPDTLRSMNNLGNRYADLGRYGDALKIHQETLPLMTGKLGPEHCDTLTSTYSLAASYAGLGRHVEAIKLYEETLALAQAKLRALHPLTLEIMNHLAASYAELGRHPDALKLRAELLPLRKAALGSEHPDSLGSAVNLAQSYASLHRYVEAIKVFEDALAILKAKFPDHKYTFNCMYSLAVCYDATDRHGEALKLYEETLARWKVALGPDHLNTLRAMSSLAESYAALGRYSEALKLHEAALPRWKDKFGPDHPHTALATYDIACVHALMIPKSEDSAKQGELAMDWLKRAVAAGYKNVDHMKKDTDLDPLRDRDDFKKLLSELDAARKPATEPKP